MVDIEKYLDECSARAERALQVLNSSRVGKKEAFRLRYICYVEWGIGLLDRFSKENRIVDFFAKVLNVSYEYTDDYAQVGWDVAEVVAEFKRIKRYSRKIGYRDEFRVVPSGNRVRVYLGDTVFAVRNAIQVVETMYDVADMLASKCAERGMKDYVGSFMKREYSWMNALSYE